MIKLNKFREIIRLWNRGYTRREVASSVGVSSSTVHEYVALFETKGIEERDVEALEDRALEEFLGKGRKPKEDLTDYTWFFTERRKRGVTLDLLWREKKAELGCGYSTFCRRYRRWEAKQNVTMRIVHEPGERMFSDYAGMTMEVVDPITRIAREVQVFVATLGMSNYTFAEATEDQSIGCWVGSHIRALEYFHGVPRAVVPDNLKAGVTKAYWYEPEINRSYQDFAEYYGTAILPARVRKPRDKAKGENAVQQVERHVLAPLRNRTIHSVPELNAAMKPLLEALNNRRMKTYNASRRQLFEDHEKAALQSLPEKPFVFAAWKQAKVNLDYHIEVKQHFYSVPYYLVHRLLWVKIREKIIEIFFDNKRIAHHVRDDKPGFTTLPEHMPPHHKAVKSWTKDKFLAWSAGVGPETENFVKRLLGTRDHEEQAFRSILGLRRLSEKYGTDRLEAAAKRANHYRLDTMRSVRHILEKSQDKVALSEPVEQPQPLRHSNIRGEEYYHQH